MMNRNVYEDYTNSFDAGREQKPDNQFGASLISTDDSTHFQSSPKWKLLINVDG